MAINLEKLEQDKQYVIDYKKRIGLGQQKAQVVVALDNSYSMLPLYKDGTCQRVLDKLLPFAMGFDDNEEIDCYLFSEGCTPLLETITLETLENYIIKNNDVTKMGSTNYSPVLGHIFDMYNSGKTWLGLGKPKPMYLPIYVIFITDGDCYDKKETEEMVRKMSNYGFFIQFIGIGREFFHFLETLDHLSNRNIDNAGFQKILDIDSIESHQIYNVLLSEFPQWIPEAKSKKLIL